MSGGVLLSLLLQAFVQSKSAKTVKSVNKFRFIIIVVLKLLSSFKF